MEREGYISRNNISEKIYTPKKGDFGINSFVMVQKTKFNADNLDVTHFSLTRYAGGNYAYAKGENAASCIDTPDEYEVIIPFEKFDPYDIEESMKYNIVNNK